MLRVDDGLEARGALQERADVGLGGHGENLSASMSRMPMCHSIITNNNINVNKKQRYATLNSDDC